MARSAPGEPFFICGERKLDLGVADDADACPVLRIHKLFFDVDCREPMVGYQLRLPEDTFDHPPVELHGISLRTASPLALYPPAELVPPLEPLPGQRHALVVLRIGVAGTRRSWSSRGAVRRSSSWRGSSSAS